MADRAVRAARRCRCLFYAVAVVDVVVLRRHPERSEGSPYFAFALAVARSHLSAPKSSKEQKAGKQSRPQLTPSKILTATHP
jgi:hypothetical protein